MSSRGPAPQVSMIRVSPTAGAPLAIRLGAPWRCCSDGRARWVGVRLHWPTAAPMITSLALFATTLRVTCPLATPRSRGVSVLAELLLRLSNVPSGTSTAAPSPASCTTTFFRTSAPDDWRVVPVAATLPYIWACRRSATGSTFAAVRPSFGAGAVEDLRAVLGGTGAAIRVQIEGGAAHHPPGAIASVGA